MEQRRCRTQLVFSGEMRKHAIFLSGPVGAGKTTLGGGLAERLSGGFIDGDDLSNPSMPWYCSILRTSRSIVRTGLAILQTRDVVVVAYPLQCISWIYFRRHFIGAGVSPLFVDLRASYRSIVSERRGRTFSAEEHDRIRIMIAEGYDSRPFSDLVIATDKTDFAGTLAQLEGQVRRMLGRA